jgi:hypothetical protein
MVCCSLLAANTFGKQQLAEVCYPPCGCFTNDPPHNGRPLPESPEQQALSWRLYTRQNPNIGTDISLYNTQVPLVLLRACVLGVSVTRCHTKCFLQRILAAGWFKFDERVLMYLQPRFRCHQEDQVSDPRLAEQPWSLCYHVVHQGCFS